METDPNATPPADNTEQIAEQPLIDVPTQDGTPAPPEQKPEGDKPLIDVDDKGGEDAKPETDDRYGSPENFESFTLPEGFELPEDVNTEFTTLCRELDLSQKSAQRLIDAFTEHSIKQKELELESLASQRKAWRSEVRNRPTFAADSAAVNRGARRILKTPEAIALFKDTWLSDHPAVFDILAEVGKLVGEDTPMPPGGNSNENNNDGNIKRFPVKLR